MPRKRSSSGGSAMQGGADYQNRVAAWFAVKMLAGREGRPFAPSGVLTFIRSETQESVDDLLVGTQPGYFGFIQAKRKLSLSALAISDLASVFSQIVRQQVHQAEPAKRPWSRALDADHDRFLLVTSSDSPEGIKRDLAIVLKRISRLAPLQILDDAAQTKNEITALRISLEHIDREWKKETGRVPTKEERQYVLKLLDVAVLDVASGQLGERESIGDLRAGVVKDPAQEHLAWIAIVSACKETAILRTGLDVATLRKILRDDHILLQHEWHYRTDIAVLARHTQSILDLLSENSRIQVSGNTIKIERDVVSELLKGSEIGSFVLVGQPGAGKSGVIYELARRLQSKGCDVVCIAVDKMGISSVADLRSELGLSHVPLDVLEHWDGEQPGFLLIDALDAARGEAAATTVLDFIQQVKTSAKRWSVIASVRKWDLRYSPRLRDIFPAANSGALSSKFKDPEFSSIEHINIDIFSPEEFAKCCSQWSPLEKLPSTAVSQVIGLLRVPFNLRLAVALLGTGMAASDFASLHDQIGLLQAYWDRRVTQHPGGDERERVLRQCLGDMVANRRLQADRQKLGSGPPLAQLLSSNVLTEWQLSPTALPQRHLIAFSHNVLFDFVGEELYFPHNEEEFIKMMTEQPDVALVLRPSLHMRMQRLWTTDRDGFWNLTFELCAFPNVSALIQAAPLTVVAENATAVSDVEPLGG